MQQALNLPILSHLADCESILIAGAGGGFDVYAGLPIYYQLRQMGKKVHLANYSFSDTQLVSRATDTEVVIVDLLVGTRGHLKIDLGYCPEAYLADWLRAEHNEDTVVWVIEKVGVPGVRRAYEALVERLSIDAIVLVDGGVDSLMRGDEQGAGTFLEDTISVAAVALLEGVAVKILAAIGMGTEVEEQVCHYSALENIAALAEAGGFYGSCALTPQMPAFDYYQRAAEHIFTQTASEASRIQSRIIPAATGAFGAHNWLNHPHQPSDVFHSPLMSLYWFFDATKVYEHSYVAQTILDKETFRQAYTAIATFDRVRLGRKRQPLPLL